MKAKEKMQWKKDKSPWGGPAWQLFRSDTWVGTVYKEKDATAWSVFKVARGKDETRKWGMEKTLKEAKKKLLEVSGQVKWVMEEDNVWEVSLGQTILGYVSFKNKQWWCTLYIEETTTIGPFKTGEKAREAFEKEIKNL